MRGQIGGVGQDRVDILLDLEPFVLVVVLEAHAGANDFKGVENLERPVALVGTKLAVIGVIDRDQRIDTGRPRRFELAQLQLGRVVVPEEFLGRTDAPSVFVRLSTSMAVKL